jgi:diaminopimelate epimerase
MSSDPGLPFTKMSGGGNDFLVLAEEAVASGTDLSSWARALCRRGLSVGADGILVLGPSRTADVRLIHYNADGGRSNLCGNGTRCAARWVRRRHGNQEAVTLETDAGTVEARFPSGGSVSIRFPFSCRRPESCRLELRDASPVEGFFLEVGIPHFLMHVDSLESIPVHDLGAAVRHHESFGPQGTNASFVSPRSDGSLDLRTFERGVEAETLACGTACVAAAILAVDQGWSRAPVVCHTRSGIDLEAQLEAGGDGYRDLRLLGDARFIYEGRLLGDALVWNGR